MQPQNIEIYFQKQERIWIKNPNPKGKRKWIRQLKDYKKSN